MSNMRYKEVMRRRGEGKVKNDRVLKISPITQRTLKEGD